MSTQLPNPVPEVRRTIAEARRIVVKIGTAVLTGGADRIDRAYVHDIAASLAAARVEGRSVLVVSSGAIGAGVGALRLPGRPDDVAQLQAAAAAGQPLLMSLWREAFEVRGIAAAQILLSQSDFDSRERYLNIRNCVHSLHDLGAIPIVNENDTVATEEISLGDNDVLAAKLSVAIQADALIILTTGPGVLDERDHVVHETADAASLAKLVRPMKTLQGRGGMATKVRAAQIAGAAGAATVIAPGRPASGLARILAGDRLGTCCLAGDARHLGKRQWIAFSAKPAGEVRIDEGAARALRERGASLLPKGVTAVAGVFEVGDVVSIIDPAGTEIARGLTNLNSDEARAVLGKRSDELQQALGRRAHEEVVHRDNMVLV